MELSYRPHGIDVILVILIVASSKQVQESLLRFEQRQVVVKHKFGLVYAKANQTQEMEMLANSIIYCTTLFKTISEETSPAFDEFLNLIGTKVQLQGFKNYAAGLDVHGRTFFSFFLKF